MKFLLLAFTVLMTSAAFAQNGPMENRRAILCYEPAEQGGHTPLAYFLEERGMGD